MKTCILTIIFSCLITLCFVSYGYAEKSILSIDIKDSIIELKTEKASLGSIVKAIAERVGISITFDESITEPFSIQFKGSIEECLKLLLKQKNYMMIYDDKGNGQRVLSEVFLISPGTKVIYGGKSDPPGNQFGTYTKDWFQREFGEGKALSHLVSVTPPKADIDGRRDGGKSNPPANLTQSDTEGESKQELEGARPISYLVSVNPPESDIDGMGIEITRLWGNSPFQKIGLEEGDIVVDVNSIPVRTMEEFIQVLRSVSKEVPNIRINRRKRDGTIDPIYMDVK